MGQMLHGSATTTHAVRAAIQRSNAPLKELAASIGLNHKIVAKWRRRAFVHDAPMGAKAVRSIVLSPDEEAIIVAFRTLKAERVHHRVYATRDQAGRDPFGYIEGFYSPRCLHSSLGYISPAEAERGAA